MSARLRRLLYLSAGLVCLPGLALAQADGLKHDPFTRPGPGAPVPANSVNAPVTESVWKPELSAIMLAGPKSIVNVAGALVRIGEQINGYRLVEVHEERAVFVNNKKRVTLWLRGIEPLPSPPPSQDNRGTNERRDAPHGQDGRGVAQRRDDSTKPEDK